MEPENIWRGCETLLQYKIQSLHRECERSVEGAGEKSHFPNLCPRGEERRGVTDDCLGEM